MPQQPEKKTSAQPSRGFLSRMFGSDEMTPNMNEGVQIARKEMPNMAPVEPYGFFSRSFGPKNALGYTSLGNTIYMNPKMNQGQTPQEVADTLTHEQEHIKQSPPYGATMNLLKSMFLPQDEPYHRRPNEMAAFQAEKQRRYRMGRMPASVPNFETGEFYVPSQDINLPLPKSRK